MQNKLNLLETRLGGNTAPLDMFIYFKVPSAKALLTCKNFVADNVACIMEDLNELLGSSCYNVLATLMCLGVQFFPPVTL